MTKRETLSTPDSQQSDRLPGILDQVDAILDRWLESLSESPPEAGFPSDLVASYRELARLILQHGLGDGTRGTSLPEEELDRLLANVARDNRRARQSISTTLSRFGRLTQTVVSFLAETGQVSDSAEEVLRAAVGVDAVLDFSLHRLVRVLEESALRAEAERSRAMRAVMEVLSHELDNRLGAARTATDMLANPRLELGSDALERISSLVRSSLDDAMKTVDDVEALVESWGDTTGSASRERRIPLPVLLRTIVDELEPAAGEAGVRLELSSDQVEEPVDAPRLRLVLFNLVSNGIKYHDENEDDRWVKVRSDHTSDGRLRIRVEDNGIGIAEADQEGIFHFRARVNHHLDGSGLGLAIAREAVDQLGGSLEVESQPDEGSTFTVLLAEGDGGPEHLRKGDREPA